MKTIFLTVFDGAISKNILRTDVYRTLCKHYRLIIFVPEAKREYYRKTFVHSNVIFEISPPPTRGEFEKRFNALSLHSLHTETVRRKILNYYARDKNLVSLAYKFLLWQLGRFHLVHRLMRSAYSLVPDTSFDTYFEEYRPDAVFVPNMISNEDYRLIKAARKRNIITIGMPKSWDNLTTKSFFNILPDWVMVQNRIMADEVAELFEVPRETITVVGYPQFDIYADKSHLISRDEFCARLGLDSAKRILVYAAAGHELAPHDEDVLRGLIRSIEGDASILQTLQVLVRPHPKYNFRAEEFQNIPFLIVDRPGIVPGTKKGHWEFLDEDVDHLMNTLHHADVLVTTLSTLNLEGAYFDRPLVSIAFDGDARIDLRSSVQRYYSYNHVQPLVSSGGVSVAHSHDELFRQITAYLENPMLQAAGRRSIVSALVEPADGKAGERVAKYIVEKVGV